MKRELDPNKKRWMMKMNINEDATAAQTMGIMTEGRATNNCKLQAMVDHKVSCIAKNYTVDD